jgi:predicted nucleotide-binding protein
MAKKKAAKKATPSAPLPKVFIGSSREGIKIAQALGANLEHVAEPYPWPHIFELSKTTVESLEKAAEDCRFAVFVLTPDDDVKSRSATMKSPRDNVLWEHGLFSGKNGRDHTFILMPRDVKNLKMPSDLFGVNVATYDSSRLEDNITAALSTASFTITQAIEAAIKADAAEFAAAAPLPLPAPAPAAPLSSPASTADQSDLRTLASKHVAELLSMLNAGTAGLSMVPSDPAKVERWADNVLYMVRDVFRRKQDDVYVTWLRPDSSKPPELVSYAAEGAANLDSHHTFAAGEGLAGNAWSQGKAVGHSPGQPHEWWTVRKGCENNAYLCAPVGPFEGTGGLLGVGSDKGFEVTEDDMAILQMFASLLGFVVHLLPVASGSVRGSR